MPHSNDTRETKLRLPGYVIACLAVMAAAQLLVFYPTRILLAHMTLHDMTIALDHRIPVVPAWITVYFLSFVLWAVSGVWILSESRQRAFRCAGVYVIAMLLSGVIFLAYPATIERPEVVGSGFFPMCLRMLYQIDSPMNLFPSLHVLITWYCWRGSLGSKRIPKWYSVFCFVFFLLVCCCILFVKQHAFVDIPAGVAVAELSILIANFLKPERLVLSEETPRI